MKIPTTREEELHFNHTQDMNLVIKHINLMREEMEKEKKDFVNAYKSRINDLNTVAYYQPDGGIIIGNRHTVMSILKEIRKIEKIGKRLEDTEQQR